MVSLSPAGHTRIYWDVTKMVSEHGPRIMTASVGLEYHACGIYPEYSYVCYSLPSGYSQL